MYVEWSNGAQLVSGVRINRQKTDTPIKRLTSYSFYLVFEKISKIKYRSGVGDFRLMDKEVVSRDLKFQKSHDQISKITWPTPFLVKKITWF